MTGHRRLQKQLTPPHKKKVFAFLDITFIFALPPLVPSHSVKQVKQYKPSLERIKVNFESQALVRFVVTPVIALVNTLFTSQLEELLKIWVGQVDVYLREGEERKLCI